MKIEGKLDISEGEYLKSKQRELQRRAMYIFIVLTQKKSRITLYLFLNIILSL